MNMRHFSAIDAVIQEQSISKAAKKLYITQQALSQIIQEAEEECHRPLFFRTPKGTLPTADGKILHGIISPLLQEYGNTKERINLFLSASTSEKIRVGVGIGVMFSLIYENFLELKNAFEKAFPEYLFEFVEYPDLVIEEMMAKGLLDFALSLTPYKHKNLLFNPLVSIPIAAFLPTNHPLAERKEIRLEELKDEEFSLMCRDMQFYDYTIRKCLDAGFQPRIFMECIDVHTAISYVVHGKVVFLGMNTISQMDGVKKIPLTDSDFCWVSGLLYTKSGLKDPAKTRLLRFLSDYLRQHMEKNRSQTK